MARSLPAPAWALAGIVLGFVVGGIGPRGELSALQDDVSRLQDELVKARRQAARRSPLSVIGLDRAGAPDDGQPAPREETDAASSGLPDGPATGGRDTATPPPLATREGADYVLRLPREDAVPADWAMSPQPDFQRRAPQPGDTYPFACRDLPARSIGIATVGYRHLDGLPSVAIEYVIYASAADAEAALADMAATAETCGDFTLGATTAAFVPLDFPDLGDGRFAAALTTRGTESGDLLIHVVKVRQGHVGIGISHPTYAGEAPPDEALTRALVEQAMDNLRDAPQPTGPSAN